MDEKDLKNVWRVLSIGDFTELGRARAQVHQAAQLACLLGRDYLPAMKGDLFNNFDWLDDQRMFAGHIVGQRWQCRAAVAPETLTLHLLSPQNRSFASLPLAGQTWEAALSWLRERVAELDFDPDKLVVDLPYELPSDYPMNSGEPFVLGNPAAFREIADHYSNASAVMRYMAAQYLLWLPVKTWPHHFDMATRRRFEEDGGKVWHMGVAFSPGDEHNYPEPYYHLTRSPKDGIDLEALPELDAGASRWHTTRWLGVVLLGSAIVASSTAESQTATVLELYTRGMDALAALRPA